MEEDNQVPSSGAIVPAKEFALVPTREDLVASVAAYRAESTPARALLGVAPFLGGLGLAMVLTTIGETLNWPESSGWVFLVGGWVVGIVGSIPMFRRERRRLAKWQWHCPHCNEPMIGSGANPLARAEMAIASGRCPVCGQALFPDAVA